MSGLAQWCFGRRRVVVALWMFVLVLAGAANITIGSNYRNDFQLPNTDSKRADDLLQREFAQQAGEADQLVVHTSQGTVRDPAARSRVEAVFEAVRAMPYVKAVDSFYDDPSRVNADGTTAFANLQLDLPNGEEIPKRDIHRMVEVGQRANDADLQVEFGGSSFQQNGSEGFGPTELIGIAAAAAVLFMAFGSLYAMFLPILSALVALGASTSVIALLSKAMSIAVFAPSLAALIGLGVGIDYALFIVSRQRSNLRQGHTPSESIVMALDTSGRAVLFAGITVCIALLGLFLVGISFLYGVALAASIAVLFTVATSLTLLPALLGFLGDKVLNRKERQALRENGPMRSEELSPGWYKWSRVVAKHPLQWGVLALVAMLVLSLPVLDLRLGSTDAGGDPAASTTRKAYDLLAKGFGPGFNGPLELVADIPTPQDRASFDIVLREVSRQENVVSVTPAMFAPNAKTAVAFVYPATSPQDKQTTALIKSLRSRVIPAAEGGSTLRTYVGGQTAIFEDFASVLTSKLPVFMGSIIAFAFLLLLVMFRSLLIPLKAALMNVLAATAGFGVVVAVFQWGWAASLIGVDYTGPILAFLPVMLFSILFGLSMDYEVFLVSRMHEEWLRTHDNDEAIALGQAETGRVITAAASIMVVVFAAFVLGSDPVIKLFGVGLAASIAVDALIIRTILVPSAMHLFGKGNWYLPKWLDRVLPRLAIEGRK
jgi:RND superfamily putative drug exporter